jgi:hypothetical protein
MFQSTAPSTTVVVSGIQSAFSIASLIGRRSSDRRTSVEDTASNGAIAMDFDKDSGCYDEDGRVVVMPPTGGDINCSSATKKMLLAGQCVISKILELKNTTLKMHARNLYIWVARTTVHIGRNRVLVR